MYSRHPPCIAFYSFSHSHFNFTPTPSASHTSRVRYTTAGEVFPARLLPLSPASPQFPSPSAPTLPGCDTLRRPSLAPPSSPPPACAPGIAPEPAAAPSLGQPLLLTSSFSAAAKQVGGVRQGSSLCEADGGRLFVTRRLTGVDSVRSLQATGWPTWIKLSTCLYPYVLAYPKWPPHAPLGRNVP